MLDARAVAALWGGGVQVPVTGNAGGFCTGQCSISGGWMLPTLAYVQFMKTYQLVFKVCILFYVAIMH